MPQAAQAPSFTLRVFLVEDSSMVRERLERLLVAGTRTVGYASGADAAISAILSEQPDVVVLDLKLAQGSGFDVLRAVRDRSPGIEFYMLSNFATEPYRRLAERLGARDFFDKTKEFERVREIIAARAANRH
jgi:DNA-binding NarL/FixJ family response regulator